MESTTTLDISATYHNLDDGDPRKYKDYCWSYIMPSFDIELTGRYKYVRHAPDHYCVMVEYFYTPSVDNKVIAEWETMEDGTQLRRIARGWIDGDYLNIEQTVRYTKEESEIMECCNGLS